MTRNNNKIIRSVSVSQSLLSVGFENIWPNDNAILN